MTDLQGSAPRSRGWVRRLPAVRPPGWIVVATLWTLFAANFVRFSTVRHTDAELNFLFLQRLFGEDAHPPVAYQFGLAFFWAPFYALGKLVAAAGVSSLSDVAATQAMLAIGSIVYVLAAALAATVLVRRLGLPHAPAVVLLALFGSPLFFLGSFSPLRTHPQEALLLTVALVLLLAVFRGSEPRPRLAAAAGLVLALAVSVRWFNAAEGLAAAAGLLASGRRRDAATLSVASLAGIGVLVLVPVVLGVPLFRHGGYSTEAIGFSPGSVPKMLFTDHRGLFVWTPLTLLSVAGYVRLLRGGRDRAFLATALAMGVGLALAYELYPAWDAGYSFSARYLSPLFPLFAIGLGGLLDYRPRLVLALAALTAAWTIFLGLNVGLPFGGYGFDTGNASDIAGRAVDGRMTPGRFAYGVWHGSHLRDVVAR